MGPVQGGVDVGHDGLDRRAHRRGVLAGERVQADGQQLPALADARRRRRRRGRGCPNARGGVSRFGRVRHALPRGAVPGARSEGKGVRDAAAGARERRGSQTGAAVHAEAAGGEVAVPRQAWGRRGDRVRMTLTCVTRRLDYVHR